MWQAASVLSHREPDKLCAGQDSRKYRSKGSIQLWHWCYATALGSLSLLPMMSWGGVFFPTTEGMPCVQGMGRNHRDRSGRYTILCVTNVCLLPHRRPMVRHLGRLGAHINLSVGV